MDEPNYDKDTRSAIFQGKPIMVTHITPILTPRQKEQRKQEIEQQLFDVFRKYKTSCEK